MHLHLQGQTVQVRRHVRALNLVHCEVLYCNVKNIIFLQNFSSLCVFEGDYAINLSSKLDYVFMRNILKSKQYMEYDALTTATIILQSSGAGRAVIS